MIRIIKNGNLENGVRFTNSVKSNRNEYTFDELLASLASYNSFAEKEPDDNICITAKIGAEAFLEQCAEECSELAQACLKMARKLRGENPTPANESLLYQNMCEEFADVLNCINVAMDEGVVNPDTITHTAALKRDRWMRRIAEKDN